MLSFLPATTHGQRWNVPELASTLLYVTIAALHEKGNRALDELRLLLRPGVDAGGGRRGCRQTLVGVFKTHERGWLEQPAPETPCSLGRKQPTRLTVRRKQKSSLPESNESAADSRPRGLRGVVPAENSPPSAQARWIRDQPSPPIDATSIPGPRLKVQYMFLSASICICL